jgi:hypothetical protein
MFLGSGCVPEGMYVQEPKALNRDAADHDVESNGALQNKQNG